MKSLMRRLVAAVRRWWREPPAHDIASKTLDDLGGWM
jgi:hypothetical protein